MIDTVQHAIDDTDHPQPYAELGLKLDEYERIRDILGRRPTSSELAMYSVMWSEHCSYKSSKVHLRQFGEKAPKTDALLVGIGAVMVFVAVLYLDNRAKRLAAVARLQDALRAAEARRKADEEIRGMSRSDRDDALARWMRD